MDCLREETVPVPGRSGAQSSVASTRRQKFKEEVCWVWGRKVWYSLQTLVVRVEGEEQWGESTALRNSSADNTGAVCEFSQPH